MQFLESLDMSCCKLLLRGGQHPASPCLRMAKFSSCPLLHCIRGICGLGLTELRLFACTSLLHLRGLEVCSNLEALYLSCCDVLEDISALASLRSLSIAYLSSCINLLDVAPLGQCPRLRQLHLNRCTEIRSLPILSGTSVTILYASWCIALTHLNGLRDCLHLRFLDISHCRKLFNIQALSSCPSLRSVNTVGCAELHDRTPMNHCQYLQKPVRRGTRHRAYGVAP